MRERRERGRESIQRLGGREEREGERVYRDWDGEREREREREKVRNE